MKHETWSWRWVETMLRLLMCAMAALLVGMIFGGPLFTAAYALAGPGIWTQLAAVVGGLFAAVTAVAVWRESP